MAASNDFFTLQSLGTFAGATGATTVIANGIQHAFGFNPAWLALAVAEVICMGTVAFAQLDGDPAAPAVFSAYYVAFLNGFLVFCSAAGLSALGAKATTAAKTPPGTAPVSPRVPPPLQPELAAILQEYANTMPALEHAADKVLADDAAQAGGVSRDTGGNVPPPTITLRARTPSYMDAATRRLSEYIRSKKLRGGKSATDAEPRTFFTNWF